MASPLVGRHVGGVVGVVTSVRSGEMTFETAPLDPSFDGEVSDALVARPSDSVVAPGDCVAVSGRVEERVATDADAPQTGVADAHVQVLATDVALPEPVRLDEGFAEPGTALDEMMRRFEALEAMRVLVSRGVVVGGTTNGGFAIAPNGWEGGWTMSGGRIANRGLLPEVLLVEETGAGVDVGDQLDGDLDAVVVSHDGRYWLRPRIALPPISRSRAPGERTSLGRGGGLPVATLNVERLGTEPDRIDRLGETIATRLGSPAVMALHEIERESAVDVVPALAAAVERHGGPNYQLEMRPELQDGPIVSVLLVDTRRVFVPERVTAGWMLAGQPLDNPAVLDVEAPAFSQARYPLALEICAGGRRVVIVALHLTSKWSDDPLMGAHTPPRTPSSERREAQARRVAAVVSRVVRTGYDAVVLGDLNDTPWSAPLARLAAAGLVDLSGALAEGDRYSYVYQGASQMIDYVLATGPLADGASIDVVHGQADRAAARRDTDHDGVVVRLPISPALACP